MKPIPHGTRTGYRKHGCRCLLCLTYQRGLAKRHRDRLAAARKCRDCGAALADEHTRCQTCRGIRNESQRATYKPTPLVREVQRVERAAHRQPEPVRTPLSWWMEPRCQTDRAAFMSVVAERVPIMQASGVVYRASWMEVGN
jgi:hypothetical protein